MRSKLWPKFSIVQSISKVAEIVFLAAFWHLQYIHYSCIECCWGRELEAWFHLRYGVYDVMPSKPPHVKIVEGAILLIGPLIRSFTMMGILVFDYTTSTNESEYW